MKNNECFYCLNHLLDKGVFAENTGWYHPCKFGISNEGLQDIESCPRYEPNRGFQIGGYYTHMYFEYNKNKANDCMEWVICSDGKFPRTNEDEFIRFHICDFRQIEEWVRFWGDYFRKIGVVVGD